MTRKKSTVAIVVCLGLFLGVFFFLQWNMKNYKALKKEGIESEAHITGVDKVRTKTSQKQYSTTYYIKYEFQDDNGTMHQGREATNESDLTFLRKMGTVMVTYLPEDPTVNQTSDSLTTNTLGITLIIIYGIMGLCLVGIIVNIVNLLR